MRTMARSEEDICKIVRDSLSDFPLYDPGHLVSVYTQPKGMCIKYKGVKDPRITDTLFMGTGLVTNFSTQIIDDVCFLLWIELAKEKRGLGHGEKLYGCVEEMARALGCQRVRMTASGWTPSGKTRRDYMLSLGYQDVVNSSIEVEKLL